MAHRALVHALHDLRDGLVAFSQREEGLRGQSSEDVGLRKSDAGLDLGLVAWLVGARRQDARQASAVSIPCKNGTTGQMHTPLQCVTRVRKAELLADMPTKNRLPVRVDFEVQGIGPWTRELSIYVPTAEQMAERAKMLGEMPWLSGPTAAADSSRSELPKPFKILKYRSLRRVR